MGEPVSIRTYPNGVPSWIDVSAPEPVAAESFYGRLFGWTFETMTPPGVPRYAIIRLEGADVGGVAARGRAEWSTYIAVDDIEATVAAVDAAGGRVVEPIEAAGDGGWSARCADPAGVHFSLWQANKRPGAQAVNEPGAWNFSDLHTDDPRSIGFYVQVFGWVVDPSDGAPFLRVPGYGDHLEATVDPDIRSRQASAPPGFADVIGGVAGIDAGLPPHWHVTFTVADRDAAAASAERLGATILSSSDGTWSRSAMISDPQGAVFSMSQFTPPDESSFA
jgi:predicted enzyme related to lactoylglutathione lyase